MKMRPQDTQESLREISVFPNPAEEKITLGGLKGQTEYEVCMMNSLGVTVWAANKLQSNLLGECVIAVDDLPAGVYVVRLTHVSETLMVKFVKQ